MLLTRQTFTVVLAVLCIVVFSTMFGCKKSSNSNTSIKGNTQSGVISSVAYPPGWPLPILVAPIDSSQGVLPYKTYPGVSATASTAENFNVDGGGKGWAIAFTGKYSFEDLITHVEGILLSEGFQLTHSSETNWADEKSNTYKNKSTKLKVTVGYSNRKKTMFHEANECYYLDVIVQQ